jgi:hypothetical protein
LIDGELNPGHQNAKHSFGTKRIPSGFFFDQPEGENVSVILFSNAGTIANFNRTAGFRARRRRSPQYYGIGFRFNPDPNAFAQSCSRTMFRGPIMHSEIGSTSFRFFTDPSARIPLDHASLASLAQFDFRDNQQLSLIPDHQAWSSMTMPVSIASRMAKSLVDASGISATTTGLPCSPGSGAHAWPTPPSTHYPQPPETAAVGR